jgi:hypothetical protein
MRALLLLLLLLLRLAAASAAAGCGSMAPGAPRSVAVSARAIAPDFFFPCRALSALSRSGDPRRLAPGVPAGETAASIARSLINSTTN